MSAFVFKKTPTSSISPPVVTEDVKFFFDSNGQARVWQGGQSQPGFITGTTEVTDEVILQALLRILVAGNNFSITQQGNQLVLSATNQSTGAVPVITAVPVVSSAIAGQPLTFSPVQVTGTEPISTVYSVWINNIQQQNNVTTGSYTVPSTEAGKSLFVRAVSTNAFGSDTEQSASVVIQMEQQTVQTVPVITAVPVVITAVAGQPLTFSPVQVVGTAPISTVYSVWINNIQQQSGVTTGSYTVPSTEAGKSIFVRAVSTNAFGSDTEQSASVVIQTEQQAVQTYAAADYFVTNSDYNAPESTPTPSAGTYASGDYFVTGSDYNSPESQVSTTQTYSSEDYFVTNSDYAFA